MILSTTYSHFCCSLLLKSNQINNLYLNVFSNILIGWKSLKTRFYVYYLFDFFLVLNKNKYSYYVVKVLIFIIGSPDYSMTTVQITYQENYKYVYFLVVYKTKIVIMFLTFLYSISAYPINLWQY